MNSKLSVAFYHDLCDEVRIINSTFTFPLIFVTFYFFIFNLFSCYHHIWTVVIDSDYLPILFATDGFAVIFSFVLQSMLIHSGLSTSEELEETPVIISKIVNSHNCDKDDRKIFKNFLVQNQYRTTKLQTSLFVINWKLLLAVSEIINVFFAYQPFILLHRLYQRLQLTWSSHVSLTILQES